MSSMHLFNCLNPVEITLYGEKRFVPCGKCDYCRYVRSLGRCQRLTDMMRSYKFALFVTLTYHDAFLPLARLNSYNYYLYRISGDYSSAPDGLCSDVSKLSSKELHLYDCLVNKYGGLPVLDRYDFQTFMKRLRINYKRFYKKTYEKEPSQIKYFACGEYGPTTYRPHFHLTLLSNERFFLQDVSSIVRSSWKFGIAHMRILNTKSEDASYIANYSTAILRLPRFYQTKMVAPFFVSSKADTIDSCQFTKEEIKESYSNRSATINCTEVDGTKRVVPIPLYLENKLYPKFSGFARLSYSNIIGIFKPLQEFKEIDSPRKYMLQFLYDAQTSKHYDIQCYYDVFLKGYHPIDRENFLCSCAQSIYYCFKRYEKISKFFGISIDEAVQATLDYSYNKAMYQLKNQFEFEDTFFLSHPDWLNFLEPHPVSEDVMMKTEFGRVLNHVRGNIEHSHKNRRKREYLSNHPEYSYIDEFDDCRDFFAPQLFT